MTLSSNFFIYSTRAWQILSNAYKQEKSSSTFLLYGKEGSGRWLHAVAFTALMNCENPQDTGTVMIPCHECRNCLNIFHLNFESLKIALPIPPHENKVENAIDLTNEYIALKKDEPFAVLKASKSTNISIALAREIKKSLGMRIEGNDTRVVLFYKMERMRHDSADALLKMIEEPPAKTIIMLIADNIDSLLPTIQSRAQKIKVPPVKVEDIKSYLLDNYDLTEKKAELVSRLAEGSIGDAIDLIEGSSEDGHSDRAVNFLLFKSLFLDTGAETLSRMNEMISARDKSIAIDLLTLWQHLIRDVARYAVTSDEAEISNIDFLSDIRSLSSYFNRKNLASELAESIKFTLADLNRNVHIQGALMALVLKMKASIAGA